MKISLEHISKKFLKHWVFRDITLDFEGPGTYAILGRNGSGKSTLLRIIAGMQSPSQGKVHYEYLQQKLNPNEIFQWVSFCAPGMELIEEMSLIEFLQFHFSFKKIANNLSIQDIIEISGLSPHAHVLLGDYSSGMKQRVKLLQAIFADSPILLLDEPCTNLDHHGITQYQSWISAHTANRLVLVASNDPQEYGFCTQTISMESFS